MGISTEKQKSHFNRQGISLTVLHTLLGIFSWLIGFFRLTDEERLEAGIDVGSKERDG